MADVRETLAHLFGLGRYQDVQVDAALTGDGVVLTYRLVPVQRVRRIAFEGSLAARKRAAARRRGPLRRIAAARARTAGGDARCRRSIAIAAIRARRLRRRPRRRATAASATLVFAMKPGVRARIGVDRRPGRAARSAPTSLEKLGLRTGEPYDGVAVDARLAKYAEQLRGQGYYEARLAQLPRFVDEDRDASTWCSASIPGPHVEIVFQGDPLTRARARRARADRPRAFGGRRPARGREIRHRGALPRAAATATRARTTSAIRAGGVLRIVFTVTRGPQCVLERRADHRQLVDVVRRAQRRSSAPQVGEPFNENTLGADAARIAGVYRRRGFAGVKVAAEIERGDVRAGVVPVRVRWSSPRASAAWSSRWRSTATPTSAPTCFARS